MSASLLLPFLLKDKTIVPAALPEAGMIHFESDAMIGAGANTKLKKGSRFGDWLNIAIRSRDSVKECRPQDTQATPSVTAI